MSTLVITSVVTNAGGSSPAVTSTVTSLLPPPAPTISVVPTSGPVGTTYTVTVIGTDPNPAPQPPMTATLTRSDAGAVTPVTGQPVNTFKWTFVF